MFTKLSSEKKPSSIMKQILGAIENGALKESDKLPNETELSRVFGVSRSVVREAMSGLVTLGVVKRIPGTGTFVQNPKPSSVPGAPDRVIFWDHLEEIEKVEGSYDAYLARFLIEPVITEYAARRMGKKDFKVLRTIYKEMEKAVKDKDIKKYQDEDLRFHMELAKASGNKVLFIIFKEVMDLIGFNLWDAYRIWPEESQSILRSLNDHKELLQFLEENNFVMSKQKMEEHLKAAFWEYKDIKE
jgi:GntR family transcriptional repressor for pyruvate dehydrogenase complex